MAQLYGPPSDGSIIPHDLEDAIAADLPVDSTPLGAGVQSAMAPALKGEGNPWLREVMPLADSQPYVKSVNPATEVLQQISTTTAREIDTALRISFVAPRSGKVKIAVTINSFVQSMCALKLMLHDGTGYVPGTSMVVLGALTTDQPQMPRTYEALVSATSFEQLVPGKAYTFMLHAQTDVDAKQARFRFGGAVGPATITVTPVSARVTDVPMTGVVSAQTAYERRLWMDKQGRILSRSQGGGIATSTDGITYTRRGTQGFPFGGPAAIRSLDNGEVLACSSGDGTNYGTLWRSHGWNVNPDTATWEQVHTLEGSRGAYVHNSWSIDTAGPVIIVAEYGPKGGPADMARYVYLSRDYGLTWERIFDLYEMRPRDNELHLHGVCWDPYWGAIWVSNGDASDVWANHVSLDYGKTWTRVENTQKFTTLYALPDCIIALSDRGPNGIYRMKRNADPSKIVTEQAFMFDNSTSITTVGHLIYQNRHVPGSPVMMSFYTAASNFARVVATYDGYTFREVWRDTVAYPDGGVTSMLGPLNGGGYIGDVYRPPAQGGDGASTLQLTVA